MLALFAAVEYGALFKSEAPVLAPRQEIQSRAERLAHAKASLRVMEYYVAAAATETGLCGTPFLQAEVDVRAAVQEGLLPADTRIPELFIRIVRHQRL